MTGAARSRPRWHGLLLGPVLLVVAALVTPFALVAGPAQGQQRRYPLVEALGFYWSLGEDDLWLDATPDGWQSRGADPTGAGLTTLALGLTAIAAVAVLGCCAAIVLRRVRWAVPATAVAAVVLGGSVGAFWLGQRLIVGRCTGCVGPEVGSVLAAAAAAVLVALIGVVALRSRGGAAG